MLSKIPLFQQKYYKKCKEIGKYDPYTTKKKATEATCKGDHLSDLRENYFKVVIINIFTELKKNLVNK